ncbi:MAG: hypothetical protein O2909_04620 [Chloroflexi bacterium]|nr:hypothetical protein [Chloroflexota bacterium]MDA1218707.1 hypothetical protein [Chloroflexota bacterium]
MTRQQPPVAGSITALTFPLGATGSNRWEQLGATVIGSRRNGDTRRPFFPLPHWVSWSLGSTGVRSLGFVGN